MCVNGGAQMAGRERDVLVVVDDVARHGREAHVGRDGQDNVGHGEAVNPVVPWYEPMRQSLGRVR